MKGYIFRAIIKKYWKLLLSILLVSAVGCAGMTGLSSGYLSLEQSLTHYVRDYGYPDGVIQTAVTTRDKADLLRSLPGISEVNTRLAIDTVMMSPSGRYLSVRAFSFSDEDFQRFHYWKKTDPEVKDVILLEYNFADYNGISAGDIVSIRVGDEYRKLQVAGIVSTPETLAVQPSQATWGENPDFGYIYFPIRLLEQGANPEYTGSKEELEGEGYQAFCNQFLLRFTPGADREETLKEAILILEDEVPEIRHSFLYENSVVKDRIDGNLMPVNTLTVLMPTVFFVIVLIVVFLFMSLVIRQSRREIGILRALGFSTGDVRLLFCKVNLLVSLGAIIPGTLIGIGIARYIGSTFESFFPLPVYEYAFDTGNAVLSALLTVVVGQAATLFGTSVISRIQPSEAMSRQIPSTGKLSGFGRWLTRKAGPFTKYSIISLLRNKKRLVFSVICLSASVMVIFASLSFIASKNAILTELFDKQIHYDCQVFLKDVPDKAFMEELEALDYVSETLQIGYYTSDISFQGHTETASVNAVPEDTDMIRIFGIKNEPLSIPSEGILLEKHLAAELGVVPGDLVLVDGIELEVAGISDQNENRTQYISTRQAEKLGEPTLRAILIRTEETDETAIEKGERSVQALLADRDDYLYCIFTRLFRDGMEKLFAVYDLAAWIIIGFAVLIGLIIVVNTTQTNLLEQSKELCVLRTLGFSHRTVSRKLFLQSLLYFVFSCIIGTPFGVAIARAALRQLETKGQEYPFASGIAECLLTAGLVFGYILLSHLISSRSMKKWSIVEIVKEKE